jgi:hypothetical protein
MGPSGAAAPPPKPRTPPTSTPAVIVMSLSFRSVVSRTVSESAGRGKTKAEVGLKLKQVHAQLHVGVRPGPATYTVQVAVNDWLGQGLRVRSERTVACYRDGARPLVDLIGHRQLGRLMPAAWNVAAIFRPPSGREGRPSRALSEIRRGLCSRRRRAADGPGRGCGYGATPAWCCCSRRAFSLRRLAHFGGIT